MSDPLMSTESAVQRPRIIAVSGAKGGVGKTALAANLGVYLSSIGREVVLVDADKSGANLHTFLGTRPRMPSPERQWGFDRPIETSVAGLRLVDSGFDGSHVGVRHRSQRELIRKATQPGLFHEKGISENGPQVDGHATPVEYVVVDLGSAQEGDAFGAFLSADQALFVTIPEPTALQNTYRFVRRAFLSYLRSTVTNLDDRRHLLRCARELGGSPSPLDLWRLLEDDGDPRADIVRERMEAFHPAIVVNQTRLRADLDLGESLHTAVKRRLGIRVDYLGYVEYDDTVWSALRNGRVLLVENPGTKASKNVERIARRILSNESGARKIPPRTVPPESHHDILEVERGTTEEELRRAYKRIKELYARDSLQCYSLFSPNEFDALHARIEEAYEVLADAARRKPYELSVFPHGDSSFLQGQYSNDAVDPLPPAPELGPDTVFDGSLLRAVRLSTGASLEDLARATKIGLPYLNAIETDAFESLPAPVYVKGFVTLIARYLSLEPSQVSKTYGRRFEDYLRNRETAAQ